MKNLSNANYVLYKMRMSKGLSQKEVAQLLHVTPKTVSNWERNITRANVETIRAFVKALNIDIDTFLAELNTGADSKDNLLFFICPVCKSIIWSFDKCTPSCCGHKTEPLKARKSDVDHELFIEENFDSSCTITCRHSAAKNHYIKFIAYVFNNFVIAANIEPETDLNIDFPLMFGGKLYFYCTKHGFFYNV